MGILSLILFIPVAGALVIALIPGLRHQIVKFLALAAAAIPLALSVYLFVSYDVTGGFPV
jgi:NADH:ubiquinone oxidoreductase subunit 4 (subunit M)